VSEQNSGAAGIRAALSDLLPVLIPGATFDAAGDEVIIPVADGRARVAVGSLVATAEGIPQERWPQLVEEWCAGALEQLRAPTPTPTVDDLRVRLVPRGPVVDDQVIVRPYGAYFQLELMADLADRRLGNGLTIWLAADDGNPWVSAGLTSVANLFRRPELPYGAIVAVPRLSTVLFTPVESDRVMADILLLGRLVADMHRDGADRCSPDLFWLHDGAIYRIERGDGTRVTLPVELEPVVAALPKS
jgi:hypothetical protein